MRGRWPGRACDGQAVTSGKRRNASRQLAPVNLHQFNEIDCATDVYRAMLAAAPEFEWQDK